MVETELLSLMEDIVVAAAVAVVVLDSACPDIHSHTHQH